MLSPFGLTYLLCPAIRRREQQVLPMSVRQSVIWFLLNTLSLYNANHLKFTNKIKDHKKKAMFDLRFYHFIRFGAIIFFAKSKIQKRIFLLNWDGKNIFLFAKLKIPKKQTLWLSVKIISRKNTNATKNSLNVNSHLEFFMGEIGHYNDDMISLSDT